MGLPTSPASSTDSIATSTPPPPPSSLEASVLSLLAAAYYITASVVLTVVNKLLFSRFANVHAPLLLFGQALTTALVLPLLTRTGRFSTPPLHAWPRATWRLYAPLWLCNVSLLLSSMLALKLTSLLMNNTLRRTGMVFVVAIHCALNRVWPRSYTVLATLLVTGGAVLAGRTDLAFDAVGYGVAFVANVSSATYLVLVTRVRDALELSNIELVFVNAVTNVPFLALLMLAWPPHVEMLALFHSARFCQLFGASCLLSIVINHAIFVNTTTNDAIAHTVTGQLKDVVLLVLSYSVIDNPASRSRGNMQGVVIGFLGSFLYGAGKVCDKVVQSRDARGGTVHQRGRDKAALHGRRLDDSDISEVSESGCDDACSADDQPGERVAEVMEARVLKARGARDERGGERLGGDGRGVTR